MAGSERKKSPHCERVDGEDRMVRDHSGLWEWRAIPADSQLENEDGIPQLQIDGNTSFSQWSL